MATDPHEQLSIFLRDVKDDPDDDLARHVLADWLQDQGDPRGELIALDLQRHQAGEDEEEIWHRERQLLRVHAFEWIGPWIDLAKSWSFQRGFLHIEARADRLLTAEVEKLLEEGVFDWVERVWLREVDTRSIRRLAQSRLLSALPILDLSQNNLNSEGVVGFFRELPVEGVRVLDLSRNRIGPGGAEVLARSSQVATYRRINLAHNRITDAGALALSGSPYLEKVRSLDVRGNDLGSEAVKALRERFGERVLLGRTGA